MGLRNSFWIDFGGSCDARGSEFSERVWGSCDAVESEKVFEDILREL